MQLHINTYVYIYLCMNRNMNIYILTILLIIVPRNSSSVIVAASSALGAYLLYFIWVSPASTFFIVLSTITFPVFSTASSIGASPALLTK